MFERLSEEFSAVAVKYLSAVDADSSASHQHEIGGLTKAGFGPALGSLAEGEKRVIAARLVYFRADDELISCEDSLTWYDARYGKRSPEYRLYYRSNEVTARFRPGDFFLISMTKSGQLLLLFAPQGSDHERQLRSIFDVPDRAMGSQLTKVDLDASTLVLPLRLIFEQMGIDLYDEATAFADVADELYQRHGSRFPSTLEVSRVARQLCASDRSTCEDPDRVLLEWMAAEERLFRAVERKLVADRLRLGFGVDGHDVDGFIAFSLSVQNRRKSRAGLAFENHLEEIFLAANIGFERGAKTEGKQRPDFLFPSAVAYADPSYPSACLRMLGAKTSCKERWRQILAEAARIQRKHLVTLESAISEDQTRQMRQMNVQLVVPLPIQVTYQPQQRTYLMSLLEFIAEVRKA